MATKPVTVTNEQILQEVMKIHVRLAEMAITESARLEREKVQAELILAHEHALNGNGRVGIKTEMHLLTTNMARINWIAGAIVLAMIADIISRIYK